MFEVVDDGRVPRAVVVRGTGGFTGQSAIFSGPKSRSLAEAYARCLNAGAAYQRRRTDPGFNGRCALDPRRRDPCMSGA